MIESLQGKGGQLKDKLQAKDYIDQLKKLLEDIQNRDKDKHPGLECLITALKTLIPALKTKLDSLEGCSKDKRNQLITEIEAAAKPIIAKAKSCLQEHKGSSKDLDSIIAIIQELVDKLKKGCD